jgi:hypothetical protein
MNPPDVQSFVLGGIATASFAVALFFLQYWRSTRDRFFLFLSASFLIEAANRLHMGLVAASSETEPVNYLVRLVSYSLILVAIWDKNRPTRGGR